MLTVYWICFAIGGTFVLLAVISGFDGVDFGDHDFDFHGQIDDDVEVTEPAERSPGFPFLPTQYPWYDLLGIVKTLKFWTFALCFFGLTGLVLSHVVAGLSAPAIAIVAVLMGIICGSLVAGSLRLLRRRHADSLVRANDLVGLTGTVEIPLDQTTQGKVRLLAKGSLITLIARTDETQPLQAGDRVLVVGTEHNRLWVVSAREDLNPESHQE